MKDFEITIPKPCHENWDTMTPNEQGKHCCVCVKTVVDFTEMEPPEIKSFFEKEKGKNICGHFNSTQVNKKIPRLHRYLIKLQNRLENNFSFHPMRKIALTALGLAMFMSGCAQTTKGEAAIQKPKSNGKDSTKVEKCRTATTGDTTYTSKKDTIPVNNNPKEMGEVMYRNDTIQRNTFIEGKVKISK
jgi:hypothetical protein